MRTCNKCGLTKALSEFYYSDSKRQHDYHCKQCNKLANSKYYKENRQAILDQVSEYRKKNADKVKEGIKKANKKRYSELRQAALNAYGRKCSCCNESIEHFLCIDHIEGGGNKHRKEINLSFGIYHWFEKNGYPKGFQVLCHNCNFAKHVHGICPHKLLEGSTTIR